MLLAALGTSVLLRIAEALGQNLEGWLGHGNLPIQRIVPAKDFTLWIIPVLEVVIHDQCGLLKSA